MAEAGKFAMPGRVLAVPFTPAPRAAAAAGQFRIVALLVLLLPMQFETFNYMIDVPPLYLLAKIWPVLLLPFTLYGLFFLRLPLTAFYVCLLAYMLALTPLLSMLVLSNSFVEALTSTNRIWPISYFFAGSALLHWLRPTAGQLTRAMLILAVATFAAFWLLWLGVPADWYRSDPALSQVFYVENERGYRIVLPVAFAMFGLFYTARRFCEQPRFFRLLLLAAGFATLLWIYKQRTAIVMALLLVSVLLSARLAPRWRIAALGAAAALGLAVFAAQSLGLTEGVAGAFGASLTIRQNSAALAFDFLRSSPLRWLLGVGSSSSVNATTLQDVLGSSSFYLADIGWLGVVFEYGLVGAALIASFDLIAWRQAHEAGQRGGLWLRALADYALYEILVSTVYSVVYAPGDMAMITALAIYGARIRAPAVRS